jgi:1,4-dihydroxy-2-naphthoate octaprenyltransferase
LVLVSAAFAVPIVILVSRLAGASVMLVELAVLIAAVPVRIAFTTQKGPELVDALKRMAAAELAYALLLTVGLLAS